VKVPEGIHYPTLLPEVLNTCPNELLTIFVVDTSAFAGPADHYAYRAGTSQWPVKCLNTSMIQVAMKAFTFCVAIRADCRIWHGWTKASFEFALSLQEGQLL